MSKALLLAMVAAVTMTAAEEKAPVVKAAATPPTVSIELKAAYWQADSAVSKVKPYWDQAMADLNASAEAIKQACGDAFHPEPVTRDAAGMVTAKATDKNALKNDVVCVANTPAGAASPAPPAATVASPPATAPKTPAPVK